MSVISVENLSKSYGGVAALRGISFAVEKGETYALLGPNGAGKTSTIEILEGYRARDGGKVEVLGMDPSSDGRRYREKIGLVLQTTALEHELTVRETVDAFSRAYPRALNVDEVIDMVELTASSAKRVKALSGGQQRRLEIALGIIGDPEVIFLDEPTTGLDPDARHNIWRLISALNARGKTILLSSHYMDEVEVLADRLAIIVDGRIRAEGSPGRLQREFSSHTEIRFPAAGGEVPKGLPLSLKKLVGCEYGEVVIRAEDTVSVLDNLLNWGRKQKVDLSELTVTRPSLEEIYLKLTQSPAQGGN